MFIKNMEEIWKDVVGYEGMYVVSSFGRVKSLPKECKTPQKVVLLSKERLLSPSQMPNGYLIVNLYKNGKRKSSYVHRLVANAFLGVNNEMTVNHKDENKTNNNIENLEYLTRGDNIRYSAARHKKERVGKSHNSIPVNQYTLEGKFVARYKSASLAANNVGLKRHLTILMCCRRERNIAGGYLWRFDGDIDLSHGYITRQRKVVQFDLEGNFIAKFDTIKEAALLTNTNNGHISSCCGGKLKTANGFRWMYEEDYNNSKRS